MLDTAEKAFNGCYDRVEVYPPVPQEIIFTDGVHERGLELAQSLGMQSVDLRGVKTARLIDELQNLTAAAVLGRGELDGILRRKGASVFSNLRKSGISSIVRLGNGVAMDAQSAFDLGIIVERTPRGNAEAVRIWQDLLLWIMLASDAKTYLGNPAFVDNKNTKNGSVEKFAWDRDDVTSAVNPASLPWEEAPLEAQENAFFLNGQKVAVIGGGGKIGQEVIKNSPFLRDADIVVYDPALHNGSNAKYHCVTSIEEALQDADLGTC